MVTDKDRYRFDVEGYVVIRGALDSAQVDTLNELVDQYELESESNGSAGESGEKVEITGFLELDAAFRALIVNPTVKFYLEDWLGGDYRLDHAYFVFSETVGGHETTPLHLGGTPFVPSCHYHVRDGRIFSGLTVVSYALSAVPPGSGFACIPGSHKAEFPCPPDMADLTDSSAIVVPTMEPGDAVIFTEALTHGATAWTASTPRRALLYKYSPGYMAWMHPRWSQELLDACTAEQRDRLGPPCVADDPSYFGGARTHGT